MSRLCIYRYRAPEQERGTRYDEKADMYSIGVILFEMLQPFDTGMERINAVTALRQHGVFPPKFAERVGEEFVRVIRWLLKV